MPPRPYEVSLPFLMALPDPEIDYHSAIETWARPKFQALAKSAIHQMQRIPAAGAFESEANGLRSFWDEWCWYQLRYDNNCGLLSWGAESSLDAMIEGIADALDQNEAVLLSCAASEDQSDMPCRDDSVIAGVIRELVVEAASSRSMSRFEVW